MRKIFLVLLILMSFLTGCRGNFNTEKSLENMSVSRIDGIKALSILLFGTEENISSKPLPYEDISEDSWYYPYVSKMYTENLLLPTKKLNPENPLTLEEGFALIYSLNPSYTKKINLTEENKKGALSLSLWTNLLIEASEITPASASVFFADENEVYTSIGVFPAEGMDFRPFIDKELSLLTANNKILGIEKILSENVQFKNVHMSKKGNTLTLSLYGKERSFKYKKDISSPIGTVSLSEGKIESITFSENIHAGKVLRTGDKIEIGDKVFEISSENTFFNGEGEELFPISPKEVLCGDYAEIYFTGNTADTVIIKKKATPENLRVVLKTTDYKDFFHDEVIIEGNAEIRYGTLSEKVSGKTDLSQYLTSEGRIYVYPENEKISIPSIKRASGIPQYRGILEVEKRKEGFLIINEIPMEEYIASVIPGEMGPSDTMTPLKVQALCSRSFAYNTFYENKFGTYGGNLDDSSASQIYNNYPENPSSIKAAEETKGECIVFENTVISANFFSTSCGVTADSGDVWIFGGGKTPAYLTGKKLYGKDFGDLSIEENAKAFLKEKEISALEESSQWFRWETKLSAEILSAEILSKVSLLEKENPLYIQKEEPLNLSQIKDIYVSERGRQGNVKEVTIEGIEGKIWIKGELAVRKAFSPSSEDVLNPVILTDNHGGKFKNYPLLPSSFFVFETEYFSENALSSVKIFGGGFGHGAGLSQTAAFALSEKGFSYEEIIKYFYEGTEIKKILS